MAHSEAAKPATATTVNGLHEVDLLGGTIAPDIEAKLRRYAPERRSPFRAAGRHPRPGRGVGPAVHGPRRRRDTRRAKKFVGTSVELDAIPAHRLRGLVRECIERHVDQEQLAVLRAAEESERGDAGPLGEDHDRGQPDDRSVRRHGAEHLVGRARHPHAQ